MKYYYSNKNRNQKAHFVKSMFNTIGTCILLVIINKAVSPHHFWAKIPIMIMLGTMIFKAFKYMGQNVSEKMDTNTDHRSRFKEDWMELKNDFELDNLAHRTNLPQKLWKDSELVKSNLS